MMTLQKAQSFTSSPETKAKLSSKSQINVQEKHHISFDSLVERSEWLRNVQKRKLVSFWEHEAGHGSFTNGW